MGLVILYLTIALSLSFLCSILEAVLLSTPMSYISTKEKTHGKSAILLKKFKQDIDRPIAAILSLNTIAHTVGADRKSTRLNSSHSRKSRMPSSA